MLPWTRATLAVSLLWLPLQSAQGLTLATNTITVTDPASGGTVSITSEVIDNFAGDFSKYEFRYTVDNLSYDPNPGTSNGLSGFQSIFLGPVAGITDQYGPPGWFFNCCGGSPPPFGAEWDINNSAGFGIPIGGQDVFGYSTPAAGMLWTDAWTGSWMHSWQFDSQTNVFNLEDDASGLSIFTPVPEPGTGLLLSMAIAGLAFQRRRASS